MDIKTLEMPYKEYILSDASDYLSFSLFQHTARRVKYEFPNGYGVSVVMGDLFHTDEYHCYEACPMKDGVLAYKAIDPNNDDVYGYLDDAELYILLTKVFMLPKEK